METDFGIGASATGTSSLTCSDVCSCRHKPWRNYAFSPASDWAPDN